VLWEWLRVINPEGVLSAISTDQATYVAQLSKAWDCSQRRTPNTRISVWDYVLKCLGELGIEQKTWCIPCAGAE